MEDYKFFIHKNRVGDIKIECPAVGYFGKEYEKIIERLDMQSLPFGDCIAFGGKTIIGGYCGGYWPINDPSIFRGSRNYSRLMEMPKHDLEKLASKMSGFFSKSRIFENTSKKIKILGELLTLQNIQKSLVDSKKNCS